MCENGFDVDVVAKGLNATYPVEQRLPLATKLMLAHLMRSEQEAQRSQGAIMPFYLHEGLPGERG